MPYHHYGKAARSTAAVGEHGGPDSVGFARKWNQIFHLEHLLAQMGKYSALSSGWPLSRPDAVKFFCFLILATYAGIRRVRAKVQSNLVRQNLSRGNFCPGTSRCLAGPTGKGPKRVQMPLLRTQASSACDRQRSKLEPRPTRS